MSKRKFFGVLICVIAVLGFSIYESNSNGTIHGLYSRSNNIEELYETSEYVIKGKFTGEFEEIIFLISTPNAEPLNASYFMYDFMITKSYKGNIENKVIKIPFNNYREVTSDIKMFNKNEPYIMSSHYLLFVDQVIHNGIIGYVPQDNEQSIIRLNSNDEFELKHESQLIFKDVKSIKKFEERLKIIEGN